MNSPQYPTARKTGLVVQEVPDEVLVYDLDTNKAHCLNKTVAAVWKSCDGSSSVSDIAKRIEGELGGRVSDDLVWLAIDQLSENALLEKELQSQFAGQSRREVLKKIGFASVVAIPVIASLVAPKNALGNVSCVCGNPGDCLTQTTCPSTVNCNNALGKCAP